MKHRIIEERTHIRGENPTSKFIPQCRCLWFWSNYYEYYYGYRTNRVSFPTIGLANMFINRKHPEIITTVHNVEKSVEE